MRLLLAVSFWSLTFKFVASYPEPINNLVIVESFYGNSSVNSTFVSFSNKMQQSRHYSKFNTSSDYFTISFWTQISQVNLTHTSDYLTLIDISRNFSINFSFTGTNMSSNGSSVTANNQFLATSTNSLRSIPAAYIEDPTVYLLPQDFSWMNTQIIVDMKTRNFSINCRQKNLFLRSYNYNLNISFPANYPKKFDFDSFVAAFCATTITNQSCVHAFRVFDLWIYDNGNWLIFNQTVGWNNPSRVYAHYRPDLSSQYDFLWHNLNILNVPLFPSSNAFVFRSNNSYFPADEFTYPVATFAIGSMNVTFPRISPVSAISFSYQFFVNYKYEHQIGKLSAPTNCYFFTSTIYKRSRGSNFNYRTIAFVEILKTGICASSANMLYAYTDNTAKKTITLPQTVSSSVFSHVYVSIYVLNTLQLKFPTVQITSTFLNLTATNVASSLSNIDTHGSFFTTNQTQMLPYFRIYVREIVLIDQGEPLCRNGLCGWTTEKADLKSVNSGDANDNPLRFVDVQNMLTPSFQNYTYQENFSGCYVKNSICRLCHMGNCYHCFPGYRLDFLTNSCVRCNEESGEIWDPLTKLCYQISGVYPSGLSLLYQNSSWQTNIPFFKLIRLDLSLASGKTSSYFFSNTKSTTFYLNQLLVANQTKKEFFLSPKISGPLTFFHQYYSDANLTAKDYNEANFSPYTYWPGEAVQTNFPCWFFNLTNKYLSMFFDECVDCSQFANHFVFEGRCLEQKYNCDIVKIAKDKCALCKPGFFMNEGQCSEMSPASINFTDWTKLRKNINSLQPLNINSISSNFTVAQFGAFFVSAEMENFGESYALDILSLQKEFISKSNQYGSFVNKIPKITNTDLCFDIPNCFLCENSVCLRCASGFSLYQNACFLRVCTDENCLDCPGGECSICKMGFDLIQNSCVSAYVSTQLEPVLESPFASLIQKAIKKPSNCILLNLMGKCLVCSRGTVLVPILGICKKPDPVLNDTSRAINSANLKSDELTPQNNTERSLCYICQEGTKFYCQKTSICFPNCQCKIETGKSFFGAKVFCQGVSWNANYLALINTYPGQVKFSIDPKNSTVLNIQNKSDQRSPFTIQITPSFVEESKLCTLRSPVAVRYQLGEGFTKLEPNFRQTINNYLSYARTGFLFASSVFGLSLAQIAIVFIELKTFFTFVSLTNLPIPGIYDFVILASTEAAASTHEMSMLLSPEGVKAYYGLNSKQKSFYFVTQSTLLNNIFVLMTFALTYLLKYVYSKNFNRKLRKRKISKFLLFALNALRNGLISLISTNFVLLIAFTLFSFEAIEKMTTVKDKLVLLVTCILTITPTIFQKITDYRYIYQEFTYEPIPMKNNIISRRKLLLWHQIETSVEKLLQAVVLALIYAFRCYKNFVLCASLAYCWLMMHIIISFRRNGFSIIRIIKIIHCLALSGFLILSLCLSFEIYAAKKLPFDFFFVLANATRWIVVCVEGFVTRNLQSQLLKMAKKLRKRATISLKIALITRKLMSSQFGFQGVSTLRSF